MKGRLRISKTRGTNIALPAILRFRWFETAVAVKEIEPSKLKWPYMIPLLAHSSYAAG